MTSVCWHNGADRTLSWLEGMAATCGAGQTCVYQQWICHGADQLDIVQYKSVKGEDWAGHMTDVSINPFLVPKGSTVPYSRCSLPSVSPATMLLPCCVTSHDN